MRGRAGPRREGKVVRRNNCADAIIQVMASLAISTEVSS
jgi:hypothetical protein